MARLFDPGPRTPTASLGLLLLRVGAGVMMAVHGYQKIAGFSEKKDTFLDPLGIGSTPSLIAAIGAEFLCAALVVIGFATRIAAIPVVFTMGVAALIVHADDPFEKNKELAVLYAVVFLSLVFTGAGRYSIDGRSGGGG